jgi:hypothetical protein
MGRLLALTGAFFLLGGSLGLLLRWGRRAP